MNARDLYKFTYQISPIFLTGGIASGIPGKVLPIVAITEATNAAIGVLGGEGIDINLDNFFAHFEPLAGSTLISNEIGQYPFANQNVAANAIITKPLGVSLLMKCPVKGRSGYLSRLGTFAILREMIASHNSLGGLYAVATPACFYTNCILLGITDAGTPDPSSAQTAYRWDFIKPLVTTSDAEKASSDMISKISAGVRP